MVTNFSRWSMMVNSEHNDLTYRKMCPANLGFCEYLLNPRGLFQGYIMIHHVVSSLGWNTVDGSEIRRSPVEVGSLSHYLPGFIHPRWCRISCINSMIRFVQICSPKKSCFDPPQDFPKGFVDSIVLSWTSPIDAMRTIWRPHWLLGSTPPSITWSLQESNSWEIHGPRVRVVGVLF